MKKPEDMTPAEINTEINDLEEQRGKIVGRLGALRLRQALDECPYHVGEVLIDQHGKRARITDIRARKSFGFGPIYSLRGDYLKADGTPAASPGHGSGNRVCLFHTWDGWKRPE